MPNNILLKAKSFSVKVMTMSLSKEIFNKHNISIIIDSKLDMYITCKTYKRYTIMSRYGLPRCIILHDHMVLKFKTLYLEATSTLSNLSIKQLLHVIYNFTEVQSCDKS